MWGVLETRRSPLFYAPQHDVRVDLLTSTEHAAFCEFKGTVSYWSGRVGERESRDAAWSYEQPVPEFAAIAGHLAFDPSHVDACYADEELVTPEADDFYGGWITSEIVGPFKREPGTSS